MGSIFPNKPSFSKIVLTYWVLVSEIGPGFPKLPHFSKQVLVCKWVQVNYYDIIKGFPTFIYQIQIGVQFPIHILFLSISLSFSNDSWFSQWALFYQVDLDFQMGSIFPNESWYICSFICQIHIGARFSFLVIFLSLFVFFCRLVLSFQRNPSFIKWFWISKWVPYFLMNRGIFAHLSVKCI